MIDLELSQDGIIGHIDWSGFFDEFSEGMNALDMEPPISGVSHTLSNPSPDSISAWISEIENVLMKDDEDNLLSVPSDGCCGSFFAEVLVDSSGVDAANASDCGNFLNNSQKDDEDKASSAPTDDCCDNFLVEVLVDSHGGSSGVDAVFDVDSNASDCGENLNNSQKEKVDAENIDEIAGADANDPISRKRRRQLRNRDAAVRSRERKKMYVRDLEMKSKFLEGECRRLGRLLQCYYAENQALRFGLQMGCASGASLTKQESAVLLLGMVLSFP